jgi:hypothetical protein
LGLRLDINMFFQIEFRLDNENDQFKKFEDTPANATHTAILDRLAMLRSAFGGFFEFRLVLVFNHKATVVTER